MTTQQWRKRREIESQGFTILSELDSKLAPARLFLYLKCGCDVQIHADGKAYWNDPCEMHDPATGLMGE